MHVLFLANEAPSFGHFRAVETVFALLMEAAASTVRVSYATLSGAAVSSGTTANRLSAAGISYLGDFADATESIPPKGRWRRWWGYIKDAHTPLKGVDYPRFIDPAATAAALHQAKPDAVILFWDSQFEHLLPALRGLPVVGYLARPRSEAPLAALPSIGNPLIRCLIRVQLKAYRRRHLARLSHLSRATNICAQDALFYKSNGIPCEYLSNIWADAYGSSWQTTRTREEARRQGVHILANIGQVTGTGNRFGLAWMATQVLPSLNRRLKGQQWTINICGRNAPPLDLAAMLDHPHVAWRGFVDDIDGEVAGNAIFLLCNNAGPYTGGYTRVAFAMSSGACLIAHSNLAKSMPELQHRRNALLGSTGEEIAALIAEAANDPALRALIGKAARDTYERRFAPPVAARRLIELASEALS